MDLIRRRAEPATYRTPESMIVELRGFVPISADHERFADVLDQLIATAMIHGCQVGCGPQRTRLLIQHLCDDARGWSTS